MKQTNNAIKFLMAQYRAIFKNANIAMAVALATAALAAGQAQAVALENAGLANIKSDSTITITGDAASDGTDNKWEKLTLGDGAKLPEGVTGVQFVISGGAAADSTLKGGVDLTGASLNLSAADKANGVTVGEAAVNADVKLDTVSITKGTLAFTAATDPAANTNKLTAGSITVGADGAAAGDAILDLTAGSLVETTSLTIAAGADVKVAENGTLKGTTIEMTSGSVTAAGVIDGTTINLNGGKVSLGATGKLGTAASTVNINKGATVEDSAAGGSIVGASIALNEGGTLSVKAGLTIDGGFTATSGDLTIADSGVLTLNGDSTIADEVKITLDGTTKHTVSVAAVNETSKLSVSKKQFSALTEAAKSGAISLSGADATSVAELHFTDTDAAINLATLGILKNDGTGVGAAVTKAAGSAGVATVSAAKIDYKVAEYKPTDADNSLRLRADEMTVGGGAAFTLTAAAETDSLIEVSKSLTVDGTKDLAIAKGKIDLAGAAGSAGNKVSASKISLGVDGTSKGTLGITGGEWELPAVDMASGDVAVIGGSAVTVSGNLSVTKGTFSLAESSTLKVTGDLTTAASAGKITADKSVIDTIGGGAVTLGTAGVDLKNTSTLKLESKDFITADAFDASKLTGAIAGEANTTVSFVDASGDKLSLAKADFDKLVTAVGADFKGLFDITLTGITDAKDGMLLADVANKVTAPEYESISVKHDAATDLTDTNKSVGSVELTGTGNSLNMGANTALTLNTAKDGMLVFTTDASGTKSAGNVMFKDAGNSLTLAGSGKVGAISVDTTVGANAGTLTIGKADKVAHVTATSIGAEAANSRVKNVIVNDQSSLTAGNVYTETLDIGQSAALYAGEGTVDVSGAATIMGNVEAGTLKFAENSAIAGGAVVDLGTLDVAAAKLLTLGKEGDAEGKGSSNATVFANTLMLGAGGKVFVDPAYTEKASVLAVNEIKAGTAEADVGVLGGMIFVGQNAAFGYGFNQPGFESVMGNYMVNGAFVDPAENIAGSMSNALVLNKPLKVKNGNAIVVDPALTTADVEDPAVATTYQNKVVLGQNSALILTDTAFGQDKTKAAITFGDATTGTATLNVTGAAGSQIHLAGYFTTADAGLKIFDAVNTGGGAGTVTVTPPAEGIKVTALGGILEGSLSATGEVAALALSQDYEAIAYTGIARPVGDFVVGLATDKYNVDPNGLGFKFVTGFADPSGFKVVDTAAHAATYAGAQQAAVASVTTMADAVVGRVGTLGVEAAAITATGSQANGGVWVTPMYKSMDSDGFDAQGASYGADVDLAGVAFGADTVNGNMRFGAVFNLGSGDTDGKGAGAGLKDEFDYYGFGIYSAMGFGNFALVGDASLTVINHDVEGLGLNGEADTSAVTMGVTGQYTIATAMMDVTPHLGARFIRLDTDSYALNSVDGTIANTDFEVQNVFSVPLGVTLSKAFTTGSWSLAPSADLTLTFNTGDTEAESTTTFTGISHGIGMSTEVLDEVQYGLTVGVAAQSGAFGTSFGVNYTGSSNTDSFGVNAQARYVF